MAAPARILRLKVELNDRLPAIWRRVEVSASATLKALHDLIQAAMPFGDYHLFEVRVGNRRYAIPDPEWDDVGRETLSAKTAKLGPLVERGVTRFAYIYNFGDD